MLHGRNREQDQVNRLIAAGGGALVLRGGPGIGKTALLEWAAELPVGRVLRGNGVEFEAELPFAGLSQLLRPVLDRLDRLPGAQRAALAAAFGLAQGEAADRLLVGFGVLSLLAEAADEGPVLCLIDDAHWLDAVSADALLFAARRLSGEGVILLFATRDGGFAAPGLPELRLEGLSAVDAARLLDPDLDPVIRYRVLGEAQGNPLALLELPRVGDQAADRPLPERLQAAFSGQVAQLPAATRAVLLVAAAEDTGELAVVLPASGGTADDLRPAEAAGLIEIVGTKLQFKHPLVRTAVYHAAAYSDRLAAHRALADALTTSDSADRRAWHLAAAATGPDDEVAAALEDTARQARDRNGYGAAAAAYERAAQLSQTPQAQARRLLLAAENGMQAGSPANAVTLAERAAALVQEPAFLAQVGWVEGRAWFWQGNYQTAYDLLMAAAGFSADPGPILLQAIHPAWYLGEPVLTDCLDRLAELDDPLARFQVASVRSRPAMPALASLSDVAPRDLVQICGLGFVAGQDAFAYEVTAALVARCRAEGLVGLLPTLLFFQAEAEFFHGRQQDADVSAAEGLEVARDGGQPLWISQLSALRAVLAAVAGSADECRAYAADALAAAAPGCEPAGYAWAQWALALLDLGEGRPEAAVPRLLALQENPYAHHVAAYRCIPDLVEAAVRSGAATVSLDRLTAYAERVEQPWATALLLRCQALIAGDEELFTRSLSASARPFERARTELLYGEWLRRGRRKAEARTVLQRALEVFDRLGAQPWAARTRTELAATGLLTSAPPESAIASLTPQELQISRLAAQGLSNKDIAAQLFLSPKTVAYHLYKAYPKLGVGGRSDLPALFAPALSPRPLGFAARS
ncbi:MAG: AAA family ATPase [Hamadaea sp.]|uniref:LuxR C-terminal-related transcriptional regulator n=1 Tax=Hamadaea sp. TaxID=2024425 RepID=UPI0017BF24F3|nr:LuxR C-terminal-related transcriptional regulator [Hamadaea sp.]NUR71394.1 AAA family ATPase [Hamadaea sp.]NUT22691.1 AAA family ATPase [Hamadaea sp.]